MVNVLSGNKRGEMVTTKRSLSPVMLLEGDLLVPEHQLKQKSREVTLLGDMTLLYATKTSLTRLLVMWWKYLMNRASPLQKDGFVIPEVVIGNPVLGKSTNSGFPLPRE
jgi:hypothetical protein